MSLQELSSHFNHLAALYFLQTTQASPEDIEPNQLAIFRSSFRLAKLRWQSAK
jgi:hypothetical protein